MTDTRSTGEAPGFTPAALSWRCRSPSHRPPGPGLRHPPGSSPPTRPSCRQPTPAGEHRHPAHISRIEAGQVCPDPARLCRGCFHPPRHPQVRLPPASTHGCHGKHILSPISHPPHHVVQQVTLGRRALPLVKAYFPRLLSMPQCPLTGAGAADCSAPVTPTKRVGWSNKRVAAVDIASARFPWIVARGEALR
jgi:hypothetical protein